MDDFSHLGKKGGDGEEKGLLSKGTKPEELKELLDKMKHISGLIQDVSIFNYFYSGSRRNTFKI